MKIYDSACHSAWLRVSLAHSSALKKKKLTFLYTSDTANIRLRVSSGRWRALHLFCILAARYFARGLAWRGRRADCGTAA